MLKKFTKKELEALKYNPIDIAKAEFKADVIPIGVKRMNVHERE